MAFTLGITGMDSKTEAEVQAAFRAANAELGNAWSLVAGDNADYVVIDMDSLYGPMSWLRLHGAGRKVIGLASGDRTQTDYRLPRPVTANDFTVLLSEIAGNTPPAAAPAPAPEPTPVPAPVAEPVAAVVEAPVVAVAPEPAPAPAPVPAAKPEPEPEPTLIEQARERSLAAWLTDNALERRVRLQRNDGPVLLIDPRSKVWHGPTALKQITAYFDGKLELADFETPDAAAWEGEAAKIGEAQPLLRLQWLGGLMSGHGALLPGLDADGKYRLLKWPQTEREYPKHFRIATAMMKGPASVAEVAEASGVPKEEVADFVNANLATGYAEFVPPATPEPDEPAAKPGGLFGRMRGR